MFSPQPKLLWTMSDLINLGAVTQTGLKVEPLKYSFSRSGSIGYVTSTNELPEVSLHVEHVAISLAQKYPENIYVHIFDPLEFGSTYRHIPSLPQQLKTQRVATNSAELRNILDELRSRITAVNQDILPGRSANETFAMFLESALGSNEKIHLFVCNGFPYRWSKDQLEEFQDILRLGPRAGVYCLFSVVPIQKGDDQRVSYRGVFENSTNFFFFNSRVKVLGRKSATKGLNRLLVTMLKPKAHEFQSMIETVSAEVEKAQNRIVDIYDEVREIGIGVKSTKSSINIPIGRRGNGSLLEFEISDPVSSYHALVGGATGSGKTVLLHNIVTYGSMIYSPEELQFCLLDYKEGTEFAQYEHFPNVKVLSIESENEFGMSFLLYIQELMKVRAALFKELGVANVTDAREKLGESIPRIAIIIDEFQVLLSSSWRRSGDVAELIDDITKRGRSFGIHLILSSQSLAGVQVRESTLAQMPIRMVLKITRDDCERFLGSKNYEPSFFRRQGQAVYNTHAGALDDNVYLNVSYLDEKRISKVAKDIANAVHIEDTTYGIDKRVFNPHTNIDYSVSELDFEPSNLELVLGEPFFMSHDSQLRVKLLNDYPSNVAFAANNSLLIYEFSLRALEQFLAQSIRVDILGHKRFLKYSGGKFPEGCFVLDEHAIEDWLDSRLTKEDVDDEQIHSVLLIPDIGELEFFVSDVFEDTELVDKLKIFVRKCDSIGIRIVVGVKSSDILRKLFAQVETYFTERVILTPGTGCETHMTGKYDQDVMPRSNGGNMGVHFSSISPDDLRLFKSFNVGEKLV